MKTRVWMLVLGIAGLSATAGMGQNTVIKSVQGNGRVSWTNALNTNAFCRLEWASQAGGPWHRFTYQPINTFDLHSGTDSTVELPLFYRVVLSTNELPVGMVWIDGGDVELGQTGVLIAEPIHTNFISGFFMDEMEVTKAQWDEVASWAATNSYDISVTNGAGKAFDHPVQSVSWYECVKWCNARSMKEGLDPCYFWYLVIPHDPPIPPIRVPYTTGDINISNSWVEWSANGYRLPTEAEWEKAARGGRQQRMFPWGGDTIQHTRANYVADTNTPYDTSLTQGYHPNFQAGGVPYTSPVGSFASNGYGLHDMAGNVFEWCWDWYGLYSAAYAIDPRGPETANYRMLRGGAWNSSAADALCASRGINSPDFHYNAFGFRCVRGP